MAKISKPPRRLKDGKFVCAECGLSHAWEVQAASCCGEVTTRQVGGDHYTKQAIQPWDVIDTWPLTERIAYYRGNVLKYMMRLNDKDSPAMNARKAEHYCAKLASTIEGASNG